MNARSFLVLAVGALCACERQPQSGAGATTGATAQAQVPRLDTTAPPGVDAKTAAIQKAPAATKASGTKTSGKAVPIPPREQKGGEVTVAAVLDSPDLISRVVRVTGRCLGYSQSAAIGPPPSSRSDWMLQAGGRTVYVVGAFPPGCTANSPSAGDITIAARVAQDTLAGFGGRPATPRRFLRIVR